MLHRVVSTPDGSGVVVRVYEPTDDIPETHYLVRTQTGYVTSWSHETEFEDAPISH